MIGMIPEVQALKITESLKNITKNVLQTLFVPIPQDENIQLRTCQSYGIPGTGKSSLYRWFGFAGLNHYKKNNINIIESTNLDLLLDSIEPIPVNFLFLEDAGLETQSAGKELIAKFTRVRHIHGDILEDKGLERKGVDNVFFNVQDPFLLEKKLRSTLHCEIWKNAPTNDYDKGILIRNIGSKAVEQLEHINKMVFQKHKYEYLSHSVARAIDAVGSFNYSFIPAKDSVIKVIESVVFTSVTSGEVEESIKQDTTFQAKLKEFTVKVAKTKKKKKEYYYDALYSYFFAPKDPTWTKDLTWYEVNQEMKEKYDINIRTDTLRQTTKELYQTLDNDAKGDIFEFAVLAFLNSKLRKTTLQKTFSRLSRGSLDAKHPDLLLADTAVNCKMIFKEDRPSWVVSCLPECSFPDPWICFYSQDKGLNFCQNQSQQEEVTIVFKGKNRNVMSFEDFLEHVRTYYSTTITCPDETILLDKEIIKNYET
jgi:hypothetical protein